MVAYRLVDLMGRACAANILGITVRELDKLVEVFEISEKFTKLRDPSAAITWARELMGVSKKLLVPSVIDAVVKKVKRITNSKDLRKLRAILPDPVARAHFLSEEGDLESAQLRLRVIEKKANDGLLSDLEFAVAAMKSVPWTTLQELNNYRLTPVGS
jgi:ParB family transcriptional regulator, chromosome partitioning protein